MQQSCRMKISHCAWSEIQVCPQRDNAAVYYRMNLFVDHDGDPCLLALGLRSKCAPSIFVCINLSGGAKSQQSFCKNMSLYAWREIHVLAVRDRSCSWSHDISLRTQKIPWFLRVRRSKRRRHIWLRRRTHGARTQQSMNMFLDEAGIPGQLAQQLP